MNSFIPWIGGKRLLRKRIIEFFPDEFSRYVEVFGGAGWVLFTKDRHAELEVWNDYEGQLINLFRCVKYHSDAVQQELSLVLNSREFFEDFKSQLDLRGLTDIQRAARYLCLLRLHTLRIGGHTVQHLRILKRVSHIYQIYRNG